MQNQQINAFIDECRNRFGAMNKNDYEVAFFHLLLQSPECKDKSDFEISLTLKIPETKIKRLRYEVALKYPKTNDELKDEFFDMIKNVKYQEASGCLKFSISDKMLRLYLNNLLRKDGRFADSSFNSDIVSIQIGDFLYLVSNMTGKDDLLKKINADIKAANKAQLPQDFSQRLTANIDLIFGGLLKGDYSGLIRFLTNELIKAI